MKKLRNKVFWVIFSILTLFTLIIFITSTVRSYLNERNNVMDRLIRVPVNKKDDFPRENEEQRRIYLDSTIYTIILDSDGN